MKNFGLVQRIRLKKVTSYISLLVLIVFFAYVVTNNLVGNVATTKAYDIPNGTVIAQGVASPYEGQSINITNGTIVQIDGEHIFANVTVKAGGSLTSGDYNRYGIYNTNDMSSTALKLFGNTDSGDTRWKYAYVMRGFINTGSNHNLTYSVTTGVWNDADHTKPISLYADNYAAIEFFAAVTTDTYNPAYWSSPLDYAYSDNNHHSTQFTDNLSDAAHPLIPFELRFVNSGGYSSFGITSCATGPTCTTVANNTFITTVSTNSDFTVGSATPELKSFVSWQGDADADLSGITNYTKLNDYFSPRFAAGYASPYYFYFANNYDFRTDNRGTLANNTNILSSPTFLAPDSAEQTKIRARASFYPAADPVSPLADRHVNIHGQIEYGYPTISQALYQTFRDSGAIRTPTKIHVTGTFTIESGGSVDLDGKGFASSAYISGSGPGGGNSATGASHAGLGGYYLDDNVIHYSTVPTASYDTSLAEPTLPGSGAFSNTDVAVVPEKSAELTTVHYMYGGGYIRIDASKITLQDGSMIRANGVGGNVGNPGPGGSGGSIILIDRDATSSYGALISAMGGFCRLDSSTGHSGGSCYYGGGGGGYIYIDSASNTLPLTSNRNYSIHYPSNRPNDNNPFQASPSEIYFGEYAFWTGTSGHDMRMPTTTIVAPYLSVSGGVNEAADGTYEDTHGQPGLITIKGPAPNIEKRLEPVNRSGSTNFNPYALQLGDQIKVTLYLSNLVQGGNEFIEDDYLKDTATGGTKICKYDTGIGGDHIIMNGNDSLSEVVITLYDIPSSAMSVSYFCTVKNK